MPSSVTSGSSGHLCGLDVHRLPPLQRSRTLSANCDEGKTPSTSFHLTARFLDSLCQGRENICVITAYHPLSTTRVSPLFQAIPRGKGLQEGRLLSVDRLREDSLQAKGSS